MNKLKNKLDEFAYQVFKIKKQLSELKNSIRQEDQVMLKKIMTDLAWISENLTVIGLHSIDQALDDTMGL